MTVKEILVNGRIYELDKEKIYDCEKLKKAFIYIAMMLIIIMK